MLIQCDASQLEWRTLLELAKDQVGEAVDYIESQDLGDLKVPLWSLFDSKQRAAMKNYTQQKKAA